MPPLASPDRVLPTLNSDGTRRLIRPRLFKGRFHRARRVAALALMVLFAGLPFIRIHGKPAVLLDVQHRQFTLFGTTFLPTDGILLAFLLLSIFVGIFLVTALVGRAWCGWACPQTVYMEFLFRPIERLIEGDHSQQMRIDRNGTNPRRVLKLGVFVVVSLVLGNVFLSYFVGVDTLVHWVRQPPSQHPTGFLVMAVAGGLVFLDFGYFREQMCTVVCPYARLQSVLLDKQSLIVGYDARRGEPRGKKGTTKGDCVDCAACVVACPTGIDIRNGLQLECIGCTQCMDACDGIMAKLGRAPGLVRYTSQNALENSGPRSMLRPRLVAYPVILAALLVALVVTGRSRTDAELTLLRGLGEPYVLREDLVQNHVRIKLRNRTDFEQAYELSVEGAPDVGLVAPENPIHVAAGEQTTESVFVTAPRSSFTRGTRTVELHVTDGRRFSRDAHYQLLGPEER